MKRALAALLCFALAGCYVYVPVDSHRLTNGERVRAYVTPEVGTRIAGTLAPRVSFVGGNFVQPNADSLQFLISYYKTENGGDITTEPTPLSLSQAALTRIEARRFSGKKSALFSVALAVGIAGVVQGIHAVFNTSTVPDSHTNPGGRN